MQCNAMQCNAMYLFPTKALAQDQLRALRTFAAPLGDALVAATLDGDTQHAARDDVRRRANVILTNPDMLHVRSNLRDDGRSSRGPKDISRDRDPDHPSDMLHVRSNGRSSNGQKKGNGPKGCFHANVILTTPPPTCCCCTSASCPTTRAGRACCRSCASS